MVLFRKALRTMSEHRVRYAGSVLLLLIASMTFVMLNLASVTLAETFERFAAAGNLSDAEFVVDSRLDAAALGAKTGAQIEQGGTVDATTGDGRTLRVFSRMDAVNLPSASSGTLPADGQVALDDAFARANGYAIGDPITIAGARFTVSGTAYLPNYVYVVRSRDELINDPTAFGVAVVTAHDFAGLPGGVPAYAIRFGDRSGIRAQEAGVRDELRMSGVRIVSWQSTDRKINVSYVPLEIGVLATMSRAVSGAMLALSCLLLGMLMWRTLKSESVVVGTFYAQGMRRRELRLHYLTFPLAVALAGSVAGAALGVAGSGSIIAVMRQAFPMPALPTIVDPLTVALAVVLPVLVLGAVTWFVVGHVLRTPIAELMKGGDSVRRTGRLERAVPLHRLGFVGMFQVREQLRSLGRTVFLLLGVVVATMLLLYGFTLRSSVDHLLNTGVKDLYNLSYEYVFKQPRTGAPPSGTEQFNAAYVTVGDDDETSFYVTGILPDTSRIRLKDFSGNPLRVDRTIITATLASELGVGAGDTLTVRDENWRPHELVIGEVANSYAGGFVFLPLDAFNAEFGQPAGAWIGIWSDTRLTFPPDEIASTKSMDAVVKGFSTLIDQTGPMIYLLIAAAVIVGLLIIVVVTGMIVDENRRTIALLKVFGYRRREVNRLVLDSNTVTVVLGYLLGVPALLWTMEAFISSLTDSLQLVIPVQADWRYLVAGFVIVFATYQLAKLLSRRRVLRVPMSEALKADGD